MHGLSSLSHISCAYKVPAQHRRRCCRTECCEEQARVTQRSCILMWFVSQLQLSTSSYNPIRHTAFNKLASQQHLRVDIRQLVSCRKFNLVRCTIVKGGLREHRRAPSAAPSKNRNSTHHPLFPVSFLLLLLVMCSTTKKRRKVRFPRHRKMRLKRRFDEELSNRCHRTSHSTFCSMSIVYCRYENGLD